MSVRNQPERLSGIAGIRNEKEYDSRWAATVSIATKIGCTPETLRKWLLRAEVDSGQRAGLTSADRARIKELERENKELRQTNEILRLASAFFAQAELDRKLKR
jgi:transposase-like protein